MLWQLLGLDYFRVVHEPHLVGAAGREKCLLVVGGLAGTTTCCGSARKNLRFLRRWAEYPQHLVELADPDSKEPPPKSSLTRC